MTCVAQSIVEKMDVNVSQGDISWHAEHPSSNTLLWIVCECYLCFPKTNISQDKQECLLKVATVALDNIGSLSTVTHN